MLLSLNRIINIYLIILISLRKSLGKILIIIIMI